MAVHLRLLNRWSHDGHYFVRWNSQSQALLRKAKYLLNSHLKTHLSTRCAHLKGQGGVKGAIRRVQRLTDQFPFVARFDIQSYYESINHGILLSQLQATQVKPEIQTLVLDYLTLPDQKGSGRGIVAGGAISPLLGALYLSPLDQAMLSEEICHGIRYQRFMDDFVIFATTRHRLRAALKKMYQVIKILKLAVHPGKRYIGRTRKGFDFLGYHLHPGRKLRPSQQSLTRLLQRARRLHEQGADENRLRQYVQRWYAWLHGGLRGRVSTQGRFTRIWIGVLRQLKYPNACCRTLTTTGRCLAACVCQMQQTWS